MTLDELLARDGHMRVGALEELAVDRDWPDKSVVFFKTIGGSARTEETLAQFKGEYRDELDDLLREFGLDE